MTGRTILTTLLQILPCLDYLPRHKCGVLPFDAQVPHITESGLSRYKHQCTENPWGKQKWKQQALESVVSVGGCGGGGGADTQSWCATLQKLMEG